MDYPGIGPEHAHLHTSKRAEYVSITDEEAVCAFEYLSRMEGIIPAIESAHAVAAARKIAPTMKQNEIIVICLSGRGDKDVYQVARYKGWIFMNRIDSMFAELKKQNKKALITFITAGDPDFDTTEQLVLEMERQGANLIELGVPF